MASNHVTPVKEPSASGSGSAVLQKFLQANQSIEFVRFQVVDYCGLIKARILSVAAASRLAAKGAAISAVSSYLTLICADSSLHLPQAVCGKDDLVPDWSSLTVCHYEPTHAAVMCMTNEYEVGFETCPRSLVEKWEKLAKEKHDIDILVGAEIEFYLHDWSSAELSLPTEGTDYGFSPVGFHNPVYRAVLEESVKAIEKAGIEVCQFHAEGGGVGLFEMSLEPLSPLKAVDALVYAQETLKTVAARHKLHATMHPKPFEKGSGVGAHMHISISDDESADSFLEGMMKHTPSIMSFGMPNFDSYDRQLHAGGEWASWGHENRLCTFRRVTKAHWEVRCLDGSANMYFAIAALICAGMGGVERMDQLTTKPREKLAFTVSDKDVEEMNLTVRLPTSLKEALAALKNDEAFVEAFGPKLVGKYLSNKTQELTNSAKMTSLERRKMFVRIF